MNTLKTISKINKIVKDDYGFLNTEEIANLSIEVAQIVKHLASKMYDMEWDGECYRIWDSIQQLTEVLTSLNSARI